jgi:hypothetical protein
MPPHCQQQRSTVAAAVAATPSRTGHGTQLQLLPTAPAAFSPKPTQEVTTPPAGASANQGLWPCTTTATFAPQLAHVGVLVWFFLYQSTGISSLCHKLLC